MNSWHKSQEGRNYKYHRETLLNYGMNRWGLNKTHSVDKVSELIRKCAPDSYETWVNYYFEHAQQQKRDGIKITEEYIKDLGSKLYVKLSEVIHKELSSITEEECIDYVYNLVINHTYEGYFTEINTVYGALQKELGVEIEPAPDAWDRRYCVDYFIKITKQRFIGIQIKPVTGQSLDQYQWEHIHAANHAKFKEKYAGQVFFIYSAKKKILNADIIPEIRAEIARLS
ncbi:MAG: MjaI family restriction endonuclease [Candidatus Cloacimonetes bacterium]|nr:MjaI family restriction endonuclease [Candidatus Cloacimonadota bacterium]